MKTALFDENTWLYPDIWPREDGLPALYLARGGHAAMQIYTDAPAGAAVLSAALPEGVTARWYQMLIAHVEANSGRDTHTTLDYESVKDFVTRKAPFDVFDAMKPIEDPARAVLTGSPVVLFVRFEAAADARPVEGEARVNLKIGGETADLTVPLTVTRARVPSARESDFSVNNWLSYDDVASRCGDKVGSPRYWQVMDAYFDSLIELRSLDLKLPSGVPVRDESGRVTGFDFSLCEAVADRALKKGFKYIYGGFVARFKVWDEPGQYLLWDRDVEVCSLEGYRQLGLYFKALWAIVEKHGWQANWMQCLVDEPQFPNSMSYRALACICRKFMPGVVINDPVESTEVEGAMDVWCVKQAVFDKYRDTFKQLQALGETLTVYTCGFPAGKWMNRTVDLPLTAGRLPFWMCAKEHFAGFLHWGYNVFGNLDPWRRVCGESMLPPGDYFIVYPGEGGPLHTLRSQGQLFGAEDCELLRRLPEEKMQALCAKLCRNFEDYEADPKRFAEVRRELLLSF